MKSFSLLDDYSVILEDFYDVVKHKKKWHDLERPNIKSKIVDDDGIRQNIFNLVDFAYKKSLNAPHVGVKSSDDVLGSGYDYWEAIDVDDRPDADAVVFGHRRYGIKISGIGHNGNIIAIRYLLHKLVKILSKKGYWIEASLKVAKALNREKLPIFKDRETIKKLYKNSKILKWFDDGSYIRTLRNNKQTNREYIFGNPQL